MNEVGASSRHAWDSTHHFINRAAHDCLRRSSACVPLWSANAPLRVDTDEVAEQNRFPYVQEVPNMTIAYFAETNVATRSLSRSVATKAGGFVFVSGQLSRDNRGEFVHGGIEAHTRQAITNVQRALELAGCTLEDVVKTTVWLDDARDFDGFDRTYAEFFPGNKPARTTIQARNILGTKIEIEAIAYRE